VVDHRMDTDESLSSLRQFAFPRDYQPVPPFTFDVPSDWATCDAPGCLIALREPDKPGTFRANITVSVDRVERTLELSDVAAEVLNELEREQPDGELRLEAEKVVVVAGSPASLRVQSFKSPELAYRVLQLQVLFFAPDSGCEARQLFTLIGTCLEDDGDHYIDCFVAAARSFAFAPS